jgi:hypothetical protein
MGTDRDVKDMDEIGQGSDWTAVNDKTVTRYNIVEENGDRIGRERKRQL